MKLPIFFMILTVIDQIETKVNWLATAIMVGSSFDLSVTIVLSGFGDDDWL